MMTSLTFLTLLLGYVITQPQVRGTEGEWTMAAKDFANTRFSSLAQITAENVQSLRVAWTFGTGVNRGQEAAPIVVGSTMYVVTPYPNYLYALDLGDFGKMKWRFDPNVAAAAQGEACCDSVNRGVAFANGKIFMNTLDNHAIAVDAETGAQVWNRELGDFRT